jgi:rubrerythrin
MGIFGEFFGDKVLRYIKMLDDKNPQNRARAAWELGRLRDERAVKPLSEYVKSSYDPAGIEALISIGSEGAINALKELCLLQYRAGSVSYTWALNTIDQTMVRLGDYECCKRIMLDLRSPHRPVAEEIVVKNPRWREDKDLLLEGLLERIEGLSPKELSLLEYYLAKYFSIDKMDEITNEIDKMIHALEKRIEDVNRDQEYYLREQIPGDDSNYDWNKARESLNERIEYLKNLKEGIAQRTGFGPTSARLGYCSHCGQSLNLSEPPKFCPYCGEKQLFAPMG